MFKKMRIVLFAILGIFFVALAQADEHVFPPPESAKIEDLRKLILPDRYFLEHNSEIKLNEKEMLFIPYFSDGSGMQWKMAFVYRCNQSQLCILIGEASSLWTTEKGLHHTYETQDRTLIFFKDNGDTVRIPVP